MIYYAYSILTCVVDSVCRLSNLGGFHDVSIKFRWSTKGLKTIHDFLHSYYPHRMSQRKNDRGHNKRGEMTPTKKGVKRPMNEDSSSLAVTRKKRFKKIKIKKNAN